LRDNQLRKAFFLGKSLKMWSRPLLHFYPQWIVMLRGRMAPQ